MKLKDSNGNEYLLEYDRASIALMENLYKFDLQKVSEQPMTMYMAMFKGAFLKNHKNVRGDVIEKIYDDIKHRQQLNEALLKMVVDSYSTLAEDNDEGNATWEM